MGDLCSQGERLQYQAYQAYLSLSPTDRAALAPFLIRYLEANREPSGLRRTYALAVLEDMCALHPDAVRAMIREATDPRDTQAGSKAAEDLRRIGPAAWPLLVEKMGDPDPYVRTEAMESLSEGREGVWAVAGPMLMKLAMHDLDPMVRASACYRIRDVLPVPGEAIPVLVQVARTDANRYVRYAARSALYSMGPEGRDAASLDENARLLLGVLGVFVAAALLRFVPTSPLARVIRFARGTVAGACLLLFIPFVLTVGSVPFHPLDIGWMTLAAIGFGGVTTWLDGIGQKRERRLLTYAWTWPAAALILIVALQAAIMAEPASGDAGMGQALMIAFGYPLLLLSGCLSGFIMKWIMR